MMVRYTFAFALLIMLSARVLAGGEESKEGFDGEMLARIILLSNAAGIAGWVALISNEIWHTTRRLWYLCPFVLYIFGIVSGGFAAGFHATNNLEFWIPFAAGAGSFIGGIVVSFTILLDGPQRSSSSTTKNQ